jgi:hypothetical protein
MITAACPECGGPDAGPVPWVTARQCPKGVALLRHGKVLDHLGTLEALALAGDLALASYTGAPALWDEVSTA